MRGWCLAELANETQTDVRGWVVTSVDFWTYAAPELKTVHELIRRNRVTGHSSDFILSSLIKTGLRSARSEFA